MTHPLTEHPLHPKLIDALSEYKTCPEAMQAAADWQLEQVLKWIEYNLGSHYVRPEGCPHRPAIGYVIVTEDVIENLKQAMRPTTTQEDS